MKRGSEEKDALMEVEEEEEEEEEDEVEGEEEEEEEDGEEEEEAESEDEETKERKRQELKQLLKQELRALPALKSGTLANGLRYFILPNRTPPQRFEAHLEVHVGSVDEEDDEQGLAHYLEHAVFLGTEKYPNAEHMRNLFATWGMSFGGDTNAYTDFRNTVYTFNAPTSLNKEGEVEKAKQPDDKEIDHSDKNLWKVLDAIHQLVFKALLQAAPIDNERGPILSEAQISNSIGYRVEYQEYQQIHATNRLCQRFPIGKVAQIQSFTREDLLRFYQKWYRPDNMSLFVVGDVDAETSTSYIQQIFGSTLQPSLPLPSRVAPLFGPPAEPIHIFQHELLHQFSLTMNVLFPITGYRTVNDIREELIWSLLGIVWDLRIYALKQAQLKPVFSSISWQFSDSFRDNCAFSSLFVISNPSTWKEAVSLTFQETAKMALYGVTQQEMERSLAALLRDMQQRAEQQDTTFSIWHLEDMMEDNQLNRVFMCKQEAYSIALKLAPTISLELVNKRASEIFSPMILPFVNNEGEEKGHQQKKTKEEGEVEAEEDDENVLKKRETSVFVTAPIWLGDNNSNNEVDVEDEQQAADEEEEAIRSCVLERRSMRDLLTSSCSSSSSSLLEQQMELEQKEEHEEKMNQKAKFNVNETEIGQVISNAVSNVKPPEDVMVPEDLLEERELLAKVEEQQPRWVPVQLYDDLFRFVQKDESSSMNEEKRIKAVHKATNVTLMELDNGIRVNYLKTSFRKNHCSLRISCVGGMCWEMEAPFGGITELTFETLLDSGAGPHSSQVIAEYCARWGIATSSASTAEVVAIDLSFSMTDGGLSKALQLVHLVLSAPNWDYLSFERAKMNAILQAEGWKKDLQSVAVDLLMKISMKRCYNLKEDEEESTEGEEPKNRKTTTKKKEDDMDYRFVQPTNCRLLGNANPALAVSILAQHVCRAKNLTVSIVGDFGSEEQLESALLKYLGTVPPTTTVRLLNFPAASSLSSSSSLSTSSLSSSVSSPLRSSSSSAKTRLKLSDPSSPLRASSASSMNDSVSSSSPSSSLHASALKAANLEGIGCDFPDVLGLFSEGVLPTRFTRPPVSKWFHITDEEERAFVCIAFPTFNRWGQRSTSIHLTTTTQKKDREDGEESVSFAVENRGESNHTRRQHRLWQSRSAFLLTEILQNRLFAVIREKLGLVYSADVELTLTDFYDSGTLFLMLTAFPHSIAVTVEQVFNIFQDFFDGERKKKDKKITKEEFVEAQVPFVQQQRASLHRNSYWLSLLEYLQLFPPHLPHHPPPLQHDCNKRKERKKEEEERKLQTYDLSCIEDIPGHFASITYEDVLLVTQELFAGMAEHVCVAVGTAGASPPADIHLQMQRIDACLKAALSSSSARK